jgi:hypothetical protein
MYLALKVLTLQIKNWKRWKCIECKKVLENKNECKLQKKQKLVILKAKQECRNHYHHI